LVAFFNLIHFHLKTYSQNNFFKYTFCEFQQVDNFEFPKKHIIKVNLRVFIFTRMRVCIENLIIGEESPIVDGKSMQMKIIKTNK
jgi:hypothetical protein